MQKYHFVQCGWWYSPTVSWALWKISWEACPLSVLSIVLVYAIKSALAWQDIVKWDGWELVQFKVVSEFLSWLFHSNQLHLIIVTTHKWWTSTRNKPHNFPLSFPHISFPHSLFSWSVATSNKSSYYPKNPRLQIIHYIYIIFKNWSVIFIIASLLHSC